jgi:hypothetical protein
MRGHRADGEPGSTADGQLPDRLPKRGSLSSGDPERLRPGPPSFVDRLACSLCRLRRRVFPRRGVRPDHFDYLVGAYDVLIVAHRDVQGWPGVRALPSRRMFGSPVPAGIAERPCLTAPNLRDEWLPWRLQACRRSAGPGGRMYRHGLFPGRRRNARVVINGGTCGEQGYLVGPVVVAAEQQVDRARAPGSRRHHRGDHRPGRAAVRALGEGQWPRPVGRIASWAAKRGNSCFITRGSRQATRRRQRPISRAGRRRAQSARI